MQELLYFRGDIESGCTAGALCYVHGVYRQSYSYIFAVIWIARTGVITFLAIY